MNEDAQAEAERIVGRVDRGPMISDISGSYKEHREAVVAALAAAIEVDRTLGFDEWARAFLRMHESLRALGVSTTEGRP